MPANPKYLTKSGWAKAGKITASIVGGLLLTSSFHLALASVFNIQIIWGTAIYSTFIVWVAYVLWVYWIKVAWKAWLLAISLTILFSLIIYISASYPI